MKQKTHNKPGSIQKKCTENKQKEQRPATEFHEIGISIARHREDFSFFLALFSFTLVGKNHSNKEKQDKFQQNEHIKIRKKQNNKIV